MPTLADSPLRKVTLNLYEADIKTLAAHYGRGWSTDVRSIVNGHAELIRKSVPKGDFLDVYPAGTKVKLPKTLGDLDAK